VLWRIDSCITQLKAQGPSRTCNESKEEEKKSASLTKRVRIAGADAGVFGGEAMYDQVCNPRNTAPAPRNTKHTSRIPDPYTLDPLTRDPYTLNPRPYDQVRSTLVLTVAPGQHLTAQQVVTLNPVEVPTVLALIPEM